MSPLCTLSNVFGREVCKDLNDHTGGWYPEANFVSCFPKQPKSTTGLHEWGCAYSSPHIPIMNVTSDGWWDVGAQQQLEMRGIWWHESIQDALWPKKSRPQPTLFCTWQQADNYQTFISIMYIITCSLGGWSEMLPFDIHIYLWVWKFGAGDVPYWFWWHLFCSHSHSV